MSDSSNPAGGGPAEPSLDAVAFDTTGYEFLGEPRPGERRDWRTPDRDTLSVYFGALPPDMPAGVGSVNDLADYFYGTHLDDPRAQLVELGVVNAGGCPAIHSILKIPQPRNPSGRTCIASLTVPFRDFSFLLLCACFERGTTGVKGALLFDRSRAAGEPIVIQDGHFHIPGFNPDDPKYDAEFPHDPVARARRVLGHLTTSLVIAPHIRELPGFPLPPG